MTIAIRQRTAVIIVTAIIMAVMSVFFIPDTKALAAPKPTTETPATSETSDAATTVNEDKKTSQGSGLGDLSVSTNGSDITIKGKGLSSDSSTTWNTIFTKYKGVIVGISGIIFLTMIVLLLMFFAKIGASGDNPVARSNAIKGAVVCGIAAALSGSVTTFVGLFWNALKK